MKSNRFKFFVFLMGFAALTTSFSSSKVLGQTKTNIVFIYADDWGYEDLSCHAFKKKFGLSPSKFCE